MIVMSGQRHAPEVDLSEWTLFSSFRPMADLGAPISTQKEFLSLLSEFEASIAMRTCRISITSLAFSNTIYRGDEGILYYPAALAKILGSPA
eukprot:IDg7425t1